MHVRSLEDKLYKQEVEAKTTKIFYNIKTLLKVKKKKKKRKKYNVSLLKAACSHIQ